MSILISPNVFLRRQTRSKNQSVILPIFTNRQTFPTLYILLVFNPSSHFPCVSYTKKYWAQKIKYFPRLIKVTDWNKQVGQILGCAYFGRWYNLAPAKKRKEISHFQLEPDIASRRPNINYHQNIVTRPSNDGNNNLSIPPWCPVINLYAATAATTRRTA